MDSAPFHPLPDKSNVFHDVVLDIIIRHRVAGLHHDWNFTSVGNGSIFLCSLEMLHAFRQR